MSPSLRQTVALMPSSVEFRAPAAAERAEVADEELARFRLDAVHLRDDQIGVMAGDHAVGTAGSSALKMVSTIVIGNVIHQRIAAGFTALTTVPGVSFTFSERKLPSLIG